MDKKVKVIQIINYQIVKQHKSIGKAIIKEIDVFPYANGLLDELEKKAYLQHLKNVPQLGNIKIPKRMENTRCDYTMIQLYLHQFARKTLNSELKYSYGSDINISNIEYIKFDKLDGKVPSVADILQLLVIAYNIGHFYNTFAASRAMIMVFDKDQDAKDNFINLFALDIHKRVAMMIIDDKNYHQFHLLNSLLMLFSCDKTIPGVSLSINILTAHLLRENLDDKTIFAFSLFKRIRDLSYVIYDLSVAPIPLLMDISNETNLKGLLSELLSDYNNHDEIYAMIESIQKLLSDTVYNESANGIHSFQFSKKISNAYLSQCIRYKSVADYITSNIIFPSSLCNRKYHYNNDFDTEVILKITFSTNDNVDVYSLVMALSNMDYVKAGYYDRKSSAQQTLLVSIQKSCRSKQKIALKIAKKLISTLQSVSNVLNADIRYLLVSKYLMYYIFNEYPIRINSDIDTGKCVIVERGKTSRCVAVKNLLKNTNCKYEDKLHEVKWLLNVLMQDSKNDTAIIIPSNIVSYEKERKDKPLKEFDGMIIYPFRKHNQVVFLEAKNTNEKPTFAKKCLIKKFKALGIPADTNNIKTEDYDCYMTYTI